MTSAIKPKPPTLSHEASATFLDDFANCDSSRDDGRLACRIFRAEPNGMQLWITRIGGCDLGANVETTVVSFTGYPLTPDESGEDDGDYNGYSPAATYEGDRVFFAGPREAARWLLDAIEDVASTSVEMARAFVNDYCEDQGFEAALFEWPQNDVAVLTLCNAQHYGERGLAVASVMEQVEKKFPGAIAAMESRTEHSYSFATYDILRDDSSEDEDAPSERAMLAIFDQSETVREEYFREVQAGTDSEHFKNLGRALERREISLAASDPASGALKQGKPRL